MSRGYGARYEPEQIGERCKRCGHAEAAHDAHGCLANGCKACKAPTTTIDRASRILGCRQYELRGMLESGAIQPDQDGPEVTITERAMEQAAAILRGDCSDVVADGRDGTSR